MNSLYTLALRQTTSLQSDLSTLSSLYSSHEAGASNTASLHGQIAAGLAGLARTVDDYETMARREIVELKKEKALSRVERFKQDLTSLKAQFEQLKQARDNLARDELLGGATSSALRPSYNTNPTVRASVALRAPGAGSDSPFSINLSSPPSPPPGSKGKQPEHSGYGARTNAALKESSFMDQTGGMLDMYIAQGQAVLGNLHTQRDMLKGTKRRILSAANQLGMSRETIQYIERRTKGDTIFLVVGGAFMLLSFYLILRWFG